MLGLDFQIIESCNKILFSCYLCPFRSYRIHFPSCWDVQDANEYEEACPACVVFAVNSHHPLGAQERVDSHLSFTHSAVGRPSGCAVKSGPGTPRIEAG